MGMKPHKEFYTQGTAVMVDLNTDVQNRGGGTYKASRVTYRNSDGEIKEQPVQQGHLNNTNNSQLKGDFDRLKAGDKFTIYKARMVKEGDEQLSIDDAKEKYPYISVLRIYDGHIIPPEMQPGGGKAVAAPVQAAQPKDVAGMLTGHALTCASHLLTPAKAKDAKVFEKAATMLAALTEEIVQAQDGDKYLAGLRVGNAVTCACITAGAFADVKQQALLVLGASVNVKEAILADQDNADADKEAEAQKVKEKEAAELQAKVADEKAAQEKADAEVQKVDIDDDDIPF